MHRSRRVVTHGNRRSRGNRAASRGLNNNERSFQNGYWYREVVQRREGVRVHRAGQRRPGRLLPSHRHPGGRLPLAGRRAEGRIRGAEGAEGPAGRERPPRRLKRRSDGVNEPGLHKGRAFSLSGGRVQPRSNKRQKELARLERRKEKDERREQRKRERAERVVPEGEDPDIAGIVPGPQPKEEGDV